MTEIILSLYESDIGTKRLNVILETFRENELSDLALEIDKTLTAESKMHELFYTCEQYFSDHNLRGSCEEAQIGLMYNEPFIEFSSYPFVTEDYLERNGGWVTCMFNRLGTILIAGKNYWDGTKRISDEADFDIRLDISMKNGICSCRVMDDTTGDD